ncbi:conserved Plasmodium protein, unknown function [Plasmodium berghei]|uniref:Uncharacterized protein n=2 Tax=Plasmodium berghei TaxID=5821 RepID=A0A509AH25_PLABA|nr:conserved protein, unknown function [Plasmodium berghei ANKA]CXI17858.1 conserved Plasmodium protein, unknown function [Plasmodium berghei]SCM19730.1 conserved Plasmodium protein, unknown function [Plasmodium berghei]SCN23465.1 conserved Plasmodium protein, unknown function [Plasmodium berghei]SCO59099.1 conserved Plasmodium protein, unknown function [Plasmodium berghei]SCO59772.1 conserved Plasmodium protein, unknown function [Plasmodium berghei]|eukprot:XP_034420612.1 conserved protein, unknown function [Plasmodium berghei ANKA]
MAFFSKNVGNFIKIRKSKFGKFKNFGSYNKQNYIYNQYDNLLNIGNKKPDEIINLLDELCKEKRCDTELIKCITDHIYDFSDDFFCPQLIKILENYVKLKYSDETLLGIVCNRIEDLVSLKSCIRTKNMINIYKQLNLHHPVVKIPLLSQLNDNINEYKNELVSIVKNISYLYVDNYTTNNILNRLIVNSEYYQKDLFTIFEGISRLNECENINTFIEIVNKKIKHLESNNICCNLKDFIKFFSAYKRLNINQSTYLHSQFEKKIDNIKLISQNNISYILLAMLSSKFRHQKLSELIIINIENYVGNLDNKIMNAAYEKIYINFFSSENTIRKHCNNYILNYLPFHILLLTLLNYDNNSNVLAYLIGICINEYIDLYDISNLVKILYSYTILDINKKKSNKMKTKEYENNIIKIFSALENVYKSASTNDIKILYNCFLYNKDIIEKKEKLKEIFSDLLNYEPLTLLPSSYSDLNFQDLEIVKYASTSYLKNNKNNKIFLYLNKNDFYSTNDYIYDNLIVSVKFKISLLKKKFGQNQVNIIYENQSLKC